MSDSGRSNRGSSRRPTPSSGGNRRAAGVRRSSGSTGSSKGAKGTSGATGAQGSPKGTSRTARSGAAGGSAQGAKASAAKPSTAKASTAKASAATSGAAGTGAAAAKGSSRTAASAGKGSKTSVNARHAAPARSGAAGGGKGGRGGKVAATNFLNYPRAGRKNPWRWIPSFRLLAGAFALMVLAGLGVSVWAYSTTEVPEPSDIAVAQTSRVYFSDGETEMGHFSEINRTILADDEVPQNVKDAVVASEDSSFYENRGISPRGIVRAFVNNLSGGARQGGSTITQQYVERYYTGTTTSYAGKVKEMFMALKTDQELTKDEILSRYLNTIYFGRGAYGVQEAAQAYFGKDASELTDAEAALLVAVIPAPSAYDPANDPERSQELWERVIERQVNETGTLTAEEADALEFPETIEPQSENTLGGTNGYLLDAVRTELISEGYTEDQLNTGGFTIVSTIDPAVQENHVQAIDDLGERPERNRVGTVSLDPDTGAITGMYGGPDFVEQSINDATQARMQAGSIFKTFTLIAAMEDGYGLYSRWDGNSPKNFPGWEVNNFNDVDYGRVNLRQATTNSINTAYAELNLAIGPERTQETAIKLGLPEDTPGLGPEASNVLGSASPTVMEMAEVYATIAAGGIHRDPYIVQEMTGPDGSVEYEAEVVEERVMEEDVAINATVALQGPPSTGSARDLVGIMDGRPVAGKTGTSESFRSAWFVGFTPQMVTGVGMFQPSEDGSSEESLTPWGGERNITGGTYPTAIWGSIMSASLEGEEYLDFPAEVQLDNQRAVETTQAPQRTTQPPATQAPEPTTEEPTTEEPTTEEPTTEEPTTEEPTTEEETTPEEEPEPTSEEEAEPTTVEPPGGGGDEQPTEEEPEGEQGGGNDDSGGAGDSQGNLSGGNGANGSGRRGEGGG